MSDALVDLFPLPEAPRVVLERSPLALTLCQLRFHRVLGVADPAVVARFQRAIAHSFPIVEASPGSGAGNGEGQMTQWQFIDHTGDWMTTLDQDFVAVITRAYNHFGDFRERLRSVLLALVEHIQPTIATRLGLRYVNEIRPTQARWPEIIRHELLGPLAAPELAGNTAHLMQEWSLRYPDEQGVMIRSGLVMSGTTVPLRPGEQPPHQPFFLLDFDAYREFPQAGSLPMSPDAVCRMVEAFHETIYRLFHWSVTDEYRSRLGAV